MSAHTKVQQGLLSTLRSTLRHIRREYDVASAFPAASGLSAASQAPSPSGRDVSHFTSYVLSEYRKGAVVKDRARVRQLRAHAADILSYFTATVQQNVRGPAPQRLPLPCSQPLAPLTNPSAPPLPHAPSDPALPAAWL